MNIFYKGPPPNRSLLNDEYAFSNEIENAISIGSLYLILIILKY